VSTSPHENLSESVTPLFSPHPITTTSPPRRHDFTFPLENLRPAYLPASITSDLSSINPPVMILFSGTFFLKQVIPRTFSSRVVRFSAPLLLD